MLFPIPRLHCRGDTVPTFIAAKSSHPSLTQPPLLPVAHHFRHCGDIVLFHFNSHFPGEFSYSTCARRECLVITDSRSHARTSALKHWMELGLTPTPPHHHEGKSPTGIMVLDPMLTAQIAILLWWVLYATLMWMIRLGIMNWSTVVYNLVCHARTVKS